jgi:predicted DCC family thiol-disulfide oxidoreductase YuxK
MSIWRADSPAAACFLSKLFLFGNSMADSATSTQPESKGTRLPDPDRFPDSDVVIYDGQCKFCIAQVKNLRRFDCCGGRLSFLSLHDDRVAERYPDLTKDQLMEQMYVVDRQGNRHGGADAVRYLSRRLPTLWPAMPILHLPGTANLWRWLYHQVAKRRYKLAGKQSDGGVSGGGGCEGDSCAVHFGD